MPAKITRELVSVLEQAGFQAGRAWPKQHAAQQGFYIRASIASAEQSEAGFARFLGLEKRPEDGAELEVYGMKCELVLQLDIYAGPEHDNGAACCEDALDEILQALALQGGLSIKSVKCSQTRFDEDLGMFICPCSLEARAELLFRSGEETGEFTDFILKGELRR